MNNLHMLSRGEKAPIQKPFQRSQRDLEQISFPVYNFIIYLRHSITKLRTRAGAPLKRSKGLVWNRALKKLIIG